MFNSDRTNSPRVEAAITEAHSRMNAELSVLWSLDAENREFQPLLILGNSSVSTPNGLAGQLATSLNQQQVANRLDSSIPMLIGPISAQSDTVLQMTWSEAVDDINQQSNLVNQFTSVCDSIGGESLLVNRVSPIDFETRRRESLLRIHRSLDVRVNADIAANELLHLLGSDRVSVGFQKGARTKIIATSGLEAPRGRSKQLKRLSRLAGSVVKTQERFLYCGNADALPPSVRGMLLDYLQENSVTMILIEPLYATPRVKESPDADLRRNPIGCLVVEQYEGFHPRDGLLGRVDSLAPHIGTALTNSITFNRIPFARQLSFIGRMLSWFHGRRVWFAFAALIAAVVVGLTLALVPTTYHVAVEGRLMPVVRQDLFAAESGIVDEILIGDGENVVEKQLVLRIRSEELNQSLVTATNECLEKTRLLKVLDSQLAAARRAGDTDSADKFNAEISRTKLELLGAEEKKQRVELRLSCLEVMAPFQGVVIGFRMKQLLQDRPVSRGERLAEVAVLDKHRLELQIPEHRVGHIQAAITESTTGELPVKFLLASAVDDELSASLTHLATRIETSGDETVLLAMARPISTTLPEHVGTNVHAKIDCGKKSLGYVLFGDVVEFVQRNFWW